MGIELGSLENVGIKKLWKKEANDFTPWLAENIDKLGSVLGKDLEVIQTEFPVGPFSADIVANDLGSSRKVVIENQYGTSDHRHLGQILLYCAGIKASCVVWIAESFKDEHRQAIEWLNNNTINEIEFFAIGIEVIRIDESRPVLLFKIIESPSKNINSTMSKSSLGLTDTQESYQKYFQSLIDVLREKYNFTNAKVGQPQNWYSFASEQSKIFKYNVTFAAKDLVRSEIYIDTRPQSKNKKIFDALYDQKDVIEKEFGSELIWERLDENIACRISTGMEGAINVDTDELERIKAWHIESLLKLKEVFPKYIKRINIDSSRD